MFVHVQLAELGTTVLATLQKRFFLASLILTMQNDRTHES